MIKKFLIPCLLLSFSAISYESESSFSLTHSLNIQEKTIDGNLVYLNKVNFNDVSIYLPTFVNNEEICTTVVEKNSVQKIEKGKTETILHLKEECRKDY